jgi:hypothetical protein
MVVVHVDWLDGLRVDRLRVDRLRVYRLRIRRCVVDVTLAVAHVAQRAEVHIFLSARTEGSSSAFGLGTCCTDDIRRELNPIRCKARNYVSSERHLCGTGQRHLNLSLNWKRKNCDGGIFLPTPPFPVHAGHEVICTAGIVGGATTW